MIQQESKVIVADNSGGKVAKVIRVLKWSRTRFAWVGDKVVVAIKSSSPSGQVDKWSVQHWIVVRTRKEFRRDDWTYLRFDDNAIALVNRESWNPLWKRIFWPVAREVRLRGHRQLATMAEEII